MRRHPRDLRAARGFIGQGNPAITEHPRRPAAVPRQAAAARWSSTTRIRVREDLRRAIHGAALRSDRQTAAAGQGLHRPVRVPGHPVRVSGRLGQGARGGADLRGRGQAPVRCARMGGRLRRARCEPPDYRFDLAEGVAPDVAVERMRAAHNRAHQPTRAGATGRTTEPASAPTGSHKTPGCPGGGWTLCGSNTYPAGDFPALPQSARRLRPQRQCRRAHEPAAGPEPDGEPRQQGRSATPR